MITATTPIFHSIQSAFVVGLLPRIYPFKKQLVTHTQTNSKQTAVNSEREKVEFVLEV
jgi:hypothetical protein